MKKIYWGIQNLVGIGGTETISIKIMNLLADDYEIHLICSSKFNKDEISYPLDERIHLHSLNIDPEVSRFDQYSLIYLKKFKLFKFFKLLHKTLSTYVYKKNKYRKQIASMMMKDDIYIGSALDSYLFAPKNRHVYFHFHFNYEYFFSFANRFGFRHSVKPEKFIFLAKQSEEEILKRKKNLIGKTCYVYNPIKFKPVKDQQFHNNSLLFVGRFTEQKDPMFALKIAKYLHDVAFKYTLTMYGEGHLEAKMKEYIKDNKLDEVKLISHHNTSQEDYLKHDLLLCTSAYEGFGLVLSEANASSLPVITTLWAGPIDEALIDNEGGYILNSHNSKDFGDKIIETLSDITKFKELKIKAYNSSKRLSDEPIKNKWKEILG